MKTSLPIPRTPVLVAAGFLLPMILDAAEPGAMNGQTGTWGDQAVTAENWGQTRPAPPDERTQYGYQPGSPSPDQDAYGAWRAYPDQKGAADGEGQPPPSRRSSEQEGHQWASPAPSQGHENAGPQYADQDSAEAPGSYQPVRDPWAASAPTDGEEQAGSGDSAAPTSETQQPQAAQMPYGGSYPGYAGRPIVGGPGAAPPGYGAYPGPTPGPYPPPGLGVGPPPGAGYGGWGGPPGGYGGAGYGPPPGGGYGGPAYGGPPGGGNRSSNMPWSDWMPWGSGGSSGGTPWSDWMPWGNR